MRPHNITQSYQLTCVQLGYAIQNIAYVHRKNNDEKKIYVEIMLQ